MKALRCAHGNLCGCIYCSSGNSELRSIKQDRSGRHGLDDRRHRPRPDDEHSRACAVLCRHGAQEERARHDGAEPRLGRDRLDPVGRVRLFAGVRRRRPFHRLVRSRDADRHDAGLRQCWRQDDPRSPVHALPDDIRVITVALVAGAVADRMRFSAYLLFSIGWFVIVYVPLAHWVWGGGFLGEAGVLDFAGGTRRPSERGRCGPRGCGRDGQAPWLRRGEPRAVRPVARGDRHRLVVGRLVRLQRRLRADLGSRMRSWRSRRRICPPAPAR